MLETTIMLMIFGGVFTLPVVLFVSALIRLFLGWYQQRGMIIATIFATLPQLVIIILSNVTEYPPYVVYFSMALVLAGALMFWKAIQGYREKHLLLETFCMGLVVWFWLSAPPGLAG